MVQLKQVGEQVVVLMGVLRTISPEWSPKACLRR